MDELEQALAAAEEAVDTEVAAVLDEVAEEFASALEGATELVAARFSVSRIGDMFRRRVPRLIARLLGAAQDAAQAAADQVDAELPPDWEDLPGRHERGEELPDGMGQYVTTTEHLLRAVGDELGDRAVRELAAGVDAGEDVDALRGRLRAVFSREEGAQLGPGRQERIARTEAARAWNTATHAAAQALTGPDRPIVKQWRTRGDDRVRHDHRNADGQLQLLDDPFRIGGHDMQHPGDPDAPADQVVNCRCQLRLQVAPDQAASALAFPDTGRGDAYESQPHLAIRRRSARFTAGMALPDGHPARAEVAAAATNRHRGMIALLPSTQDAERMAMEDGEPAEELHLTLWFLGEGADWNEEQRAALVEAVRARASSLPGPIRASAFGVNHWNPHGDRPAWVWAIGDDPDADDEDATLHEARAIALDALEDAPERPELPRQHSPWVAHSTGAYTADTWPLEAMADRLGPLTFDRVRVAFADDHTDITIGPEEEPPMDNPTAAALTAALPVRTWSNPDGTALAFEDTETGDGRIFASGAVYWETGPWPLQYADEMGMGHEGAELAGAIEEPGRDGNRITGRGPLYLTQRAGYEVVTLLEQDPPAPLGVSVDLDSVDVEFVDRTLEVDEDGAIVLAASLPQASVMRLADGGWIINAATAVEATASGAALTRRQHLAQFITGPDGRLPASALAVFDGERLPRLTAAAGDPDSDDGVVLHSEQAGDFVIRITKARLRGATLVAMPAFDQARIVLDPLEEPDQEEADAVEAALITAASAPGETRQRVIRYVCASPGPVGASEVARALSIAVETARKHLREAAKDGHIVRLAANAYVGPSSLPEGEQTASANPTTTVVADGDDQALTELVASAWTAMRDLPPMPAAWFAEPTEEELPPGSGGVHYSAGRIYGWVAQAGEPHAGFTNRKLTIDSLGDIDTTHFLRARFLLDSGEYVKAGAFTMNAPHTRDGAECDSAACQFDDTRTVAGIVTVGMNSRGMWFSGAAAPWLSEWDRTVFMGCQPSYHMKKGDNGKWQLRAVLSVPVPGHSSPLLAAAVERGNLALAASAAAVLDSPDTVPGHGPDTSGHPVRPGMTDGLGLPGQRPDTSSGHAPDTVAALLNDPALLDGLSAALARRETERREEVAALSAAVLAPTTTDPKGDQ
ncbi:phage minor head protein [Streptomyces sp. KAU_LT]|uniref:phage minor head protein n=1 Tax=Streptomyces sp. KAU_LT TaxID=3046669 RepID=UPI0024B86863|nr:phage minor head protein [Streptomyces sp. KAU_LT]MDI9829696.1 phage minor head protein [Streptomyces sp. KAU_LT]